MLVIGKRHYSDITFIHTRKEKGWIELLIEEEKRKKGKMDLFGRAFYLGGLVVADDDGGVPLRGALGPINFHPEADQDARRGQQDPLPILHLCPPPDSARPRHRAFRQLPVLLQKRQFGPSLRVKVQIDHWDKDMRGHRLTFFLIRQ